MDHHGRTARQRPLDRVYRTEGHHAAHRSPEQHGVAGPDGRRPALPGHLLGQDQRLRNRVPRSGRSMSIRVRTFDEMKWDPEVDTSALQDEFAYRVWCGLNDSRIFIFTYII